MLSEFNINMNSNPRPNVFCARYIVRHNCDLEQSYDSELKWNCKLEYDACLSNCNDLIVDHSGYKCSLCLSNNEVHVNKGNVYWSEAIANTII